MVQVLSAIDQQKAKVKVKVKVRVGEGTVVRAEIEP